MSTVGLTVPPLFASMAAHPLRWRLMCELASGDLRVGELTAMTGERQNLISYHLAQLRRSGLVRSRRSSFDGRDVYYRLDLSRCGELLAACGPALHPGLRPVAPTTAATATATGAGPVATSESRDVLFLCTGNSARSQIAEAFVNAVPATKMRAFSAGVRPKPLHPGAVLAMTEYGIDLAGQRSKHLSVFADRRFSYVVTLCDRVREACPQYRRHPGFRHWSTQDPSAAGRGDDGGSAFRAVTADLDERVRFFLAAAAG